MRNISKQIKEATKHVLLTDDEKSRMREQIVAYMEYKPIRSKVIVKEVPVFKFKPTFSFFKARHFSGALLIASIVTGSTFGVSFAASDALPGDLLYGFKVNINEEIKTALLSTNESRIAWDRERAERRLVEASYLASEGRLDPEKQEKVSKLFAQHTEAMFEKVLAYEDVDPFLAAEVSGAFSDSLETHEAVLTRLIIEDENYTDKEALGLVGQVRTTTMEVEKLQNGAEEKIASRDDELQTSSEEFFVEKPEDDKTESANLRVRAAYRAQKNAKELLAEAESQYLGLDFDSELRLQAEAQVAFGKTLFEKGEEAILNNDLSLAYGLYKKAATSFQKVVQLLEVAKLFSVEIYTSETPVEDVNEEAIIDAENLAENIIVTDGENEDGTGVDVLSDNVEKLKVLRSEVKESVDLSRMLLLTYEGHDESVVIKASRKIKDAAALMLRGEIAMVLEDYDAAEKLLLQAKKLSLLTLSSLEEESEKEYINNVVIEKNEKDESKDEANNIIMIQHSFVEGVHTYKGFIDVPIPCSSLEGLALITETNPEQIVLEVTVQESENDTGCIQIETKKDFVIKVTAGPDATLTAVKINGEENKGWNVVEEVITVMNETDKEGLEETQNSF